MFVIGVSGLARSGKDTFAELLTERLPGCCLTSFAEPIRTFVESLVGPDAFSRKDEIFVPYDSSPRHMMQTLGTEWGRDLICPNLWVRAARRRLERSGCRFGIVSDVRFPNEAAICEKLIHIIRPGVEGAVKSHVSEQYDIRSLASTVVDNSGSLENLAQQASQVAYTIENEAGC